MLSSIFEQRAYRLVENSLPRVAFAHPAAQAVEGILLNPGCNALGELSG